MHDLFTLVEAAKSGDIEAIQYLCNRYSALIDNCSTIDGNMDYELRHEICRKIIEGFHKFGVKIDTNVNKL